jgi:hypothetical protein
VLLTLRASAAGRSGYAVRVDALRYHSIYGTYGISVFAVRDATLDEMAQQVPLVRFEWLILLPRTRSGCWSASGC